MSIGQILGLVAGIFTTGSVIPQIIRVFKYKSANDISLMFNLMFLTGGALWLAYGIYDKLVPIILWNVLGLTLNMILLVGKIKYSGREHGKRNMPEAHADKAIT